MVPRLWIWIYMSSPSVNLGTLRRSDSVAICSANSSADSSANLGIT